MMNCLHGSPLTTLQVQKAFVGGVLWFGINEHRDG
jgi:hypothetical protein